MSEAESVKPSNGELSSQQVFLSVALRFARALRCRPLRLVTRPTFRGSFASYLLTLLFCERFGPALPANLTTFAPDLRKLLR
jgi:hypothetical protein